MPRSTRSMKAAAVAAVAAIVLVACGSSGSSGTATNTSSKGSGNTIASTFVLGGPPECPTRPYCQVGLEKTYGLHFKSFKPLDAGGPLTVAAIKSGSIQIGLLFTTSGAIAGNGWVLLKDDKKLQPADNVTPVVNYEHRHGLRPGPHGPVQQGQRQAHDRGPDRSQQADRHRPEGS